MLKVRSVVSSFLNRTMEDHGTSDLPSIFTETIYRLPTKDELIDVDSHNLSAGEIVKGFFYTIVGRGILQQREKDTIIRAIEMLCRMFPHNTIYKDALKKALNDFAKKNSAPKIVNSFLKMARDYSCITAPFPWKIADKIRQWGTENIPDADLINDGREPDVHVTVKYGIHDHDPYEIRPVVAGFGPIELTLGEVSIFENGDQDVVKISVVSPDLVKLNKIISDKFEHTDTHPEYIPHCTLAYVKPGAGQKYVGRKDFMGTKIKVDEILFSGNDYRETVFKLN